MKRNSKIRASGTETSSLERLNEEVKWRFNTELAKPGVSIEALTDIYQEYSARKHDVLRHAGAHPHRPEDGAKLRSNMRRYVANFIGIKEKYGLQGAQEMFVEMVDDRGPMTLRAFLDPNADGRVSPQEFYKSAASGKIGDVLRSLDLNHDGMVTQNEAANALQSANLMFEGVLGGIRRSVEVLGMALATAGVEFRPHTQSGHHGHPRHPQYVAVVPPSSDDSKVR